MENREFELSNWFDKLSHADEERLSGALEEIRRLKQECKQWKETCEVLADKKIIKSITKSLRQFAEGKGIKLKDL